MGLYGVWSPVGPGRIPAEATRSLVKILLFGATGMVGAGALLECLADPRVESVLAIGRSPTGRTHPKLREVTPFL